MFNYQGILQFKGKWRDYQARVLQNAGKYLSDGRIHIVAAPGSGKTTLGIELIRRLNEKALVLTPSITIRAVGGAYRGGFSLRRHGSGRLSVAESEGAKGNHSCNLSVAAQCHDSWKGYRRSICRW